MKALGRHFIVECLGCPSEILNDLDGIRKALLGAAKAAKATILNDAFHQFKPHGVSGVVVIAESHISIHTWPELNYAAVDLFTCGQDVDTKKALDFVSEALKATKVSWVEIPRGLLPDILSEPSLDKVLSSITTETLTFRKEGV